MLKLTEHVKCDVLPKTTAILAMAFGLLLFAKDATPGSPNDACGLPADLHREIASRYPGRTVVDLSDLGDDDKGFFQEGHGDSCPGLVKADFYGDGKLTFALVLTTQSSSLRSTERVEHQPSASTTPLRFLPTAPLS